MIPRDSGHQAAAASTTGPGPGPDPPGPPGPAGVSSPGVGRSVDPLARSRHSAFDFALAFDSMGDARIAGVASHFVALIPGFRVRLEAAMCTHFGEARSTSVRDLMFRIATVAGPDAEPEPEVDLEASDLFLRRFMEAAAQDQAKQDRARAAADAADAAAGRLTGFEASFGGDGLGTPDLAGSRKQRRLAE